MPSGDVRMLLSRLSLVLPSAAVKMPLLSMLSLVLPSVVVKMQLFPRLPLLTPLVAVNLLVVQRCHVAWELQVAWELRVAWALMQSPRQSQVAPSPEVLEAHPGHQAQPGVHRVSSSSICPCPCSSSGQLPLPCQAGHAVDGWEMESLARSDCREFVMDLLQ